MELNKVKKKLGKKQDHFVMGNSNYLRNLSIICKKKSDFGSGRIAKYYQDVRDLYNGPQARMVTKSKRVQNSAKYDVKNKRNNTLLC